MRLPDHVADPSGRIVVNRMNNEIVVDGEHIHTQPMIADFAAVLVSHFGKTVSHSSLNTWRHHFRSLRRLEQLETHLGYDGRRKKNKSTTAIHSRVSTLRTALKGTKVRIVSVFDEGYRMILED